MRSLIVLAPIPVEGPADVHAADDGAVRTNGPHGSNNRVASVGSHQKWAFSVSKGHTEVRSSPWASDALRWDLSPSCHNWGASARDAVDHSDTIAAGRRG